MNNDETIEEWLEQINHEYRDIRDLELSEGLEFVDKLRKLVEIAKEWKKKQQTNLIGLFYSLRS